MTPFQWNQLKVKASQYQLTQYIKANNLCDITIAHIIALLVYSNFDRINRHFR